MMKVELLWDVDSSQTKTVAVYAMLGGFGERMMSLHPSWARQELLVAAEWFVEQHLYSGQHPMVIQNGGVEKVLQALLQRGRQI